ncbi:MAG: HlyD family efflux transporter periplasmic adaptor subunit [Saprospiraceae bacterium]
MEEREYIELRSEEVQEILGTPPGWLVRWGTFVVFVSVAALLGVASIISYPDVVPARITIKPAAPPVDVVVPSDGRIVRFFARDSLMVSEGAVLAVLESTARYDDVVRLDKLVERWLQCVSDSLSEIVPVEGLEIGELQTEYALLAQAADVYRFGKKDKSTSVRTGADAVRQQISKLEQSISVDQKAIRRIQTQLQVAQEQYQRQRLLFDAGGISRNDLENSRQRLDDLERQHDALEDAILGKQSQITGLKKNSSDASFSESENQLTSAGRLRQAVSNLQTALGKWKQNHIITAPVEGRVSFNANFFVEKQYVRQGQQILVIVPPQTETVVGRLLLPVGKSSKVHAKQRVVIKLDGYPHAEFGTLRGFVYSKSLVPRDDQYAVIVVLPKGLETTYGKPVAFEQQLEGDAEIITDDKRFLQRVYEQIFAARR